MQHEVMGELPPLSAFLPAEDRECACGCGFKIPAEALVDMEEQETLASKFKARIVSLLQQRGTASTSYIARTMKCDPANTSASLRELLAAGRVVRVGRGRYRAARAGENAAEVSAPSRGGRPSNAETGCLGKTQQRVVIALRRNGDPLSLQEITTRLSITRNAASCALTTLRRMGLVERAAWGLWKLTAAQAEVAV